jgi:S-adenosylmethionine synthetase
MGGHGHVFIVGELTMRSAPTDEEMEKILSKIVHRITEDKNISLDWVIVKQSLEIANGVDTGGAGDQGIMKGYAVRETETLMPLEYELARALCEHIYGTFPYDGKTQITIDDNGNICRVVASFQNAPQKELGTVVAEWLTLHKDIQAADLQKHLNPAGDWSMGGFEADTGVTGRKLMVDNYGPRYAIGGGAFSGKDATKVDRSGAYMARKIAVDILRERADAHEVMVEIAYAIGRAQPVAVRATVDNKKEDISGRYDLSPAEMAKTLRLDTCSYAETAKWGHFGRGFAWDK